MKLAENFTEAIMQIERERGVSSQSIIDAIERALASAYRRKMIESEKLTRESEVDIKIDTAHNNIIRIYVGKEVVEGEPETVDQISLEDAQLKQANIQVGETLTIEMPMSSREFSKLATQVARQAITQKLREAEKRAVLEEYRDRLGTMITATVQRLEKKNVVVRLNNKSEVVLTRTEQLPGDRYRYGDKVRVYLSEIKSGQYDSYLVISRTRPGLVKCLFEIEIPEVADGTVEIKSIARDAGSRTKIAVHAHRSNVDPVGACIGSRGSRIHPIIEELRGEKIDIVRWSDLDSEFIVSALSPAKVVHVEIESTGKPDVKAARIVVPDDQLSLAIGREGQNVRLAAKLTGYHLDIVTESEERRRRVEEQSSSLAE